MDFSRVVVQVRDHALQGAIEFGCQHEVEEIALGRGKAEGVAQPRPASIRLKRGVRLRDRSGKRNTGRIGCAEPQLRRRSLCGIAEQPLDFACGDHETLIGARSLLRPQPLHPPREQACANANALDQQAVCGGGRSWHVHPPARRALDAVDADAEKIAAGLQRRAAEADGLAGGVDGKEAGGRVGAAPRARGPPCRAPPLSRRA